jgi:hypothetical protein
MRHDICCRGKEQPTTGITSKALRSVPRNDILAANCGYRPKLPAADNSTNPVCLSLQVCATWGLTTVRDEPVSISADNESGSGYSSPKDLPSLISTWGALIEDTKAGALLL